MNGMLLIEPHEAGTNLWTHAISISQTAQQSMALLHPASYQLPVALDSIMHASFPPWLLGSFGPQLVYLMMDILSLHAFVDVVRQTNVDSVVGSTRCPAVQKNIP